MLEKVFASTHDILHNMYSRDLQIKRLHINTPQ